MSASWLALLLIGPTIAGAIGLAQVPALRDGEIQPNIGTASISGMVVDDESEPKPVRRVIVSVTGSDLRPSRGTVTDDDGRFTITRLPAGRFTLTVTRAGFITSVYGAKRAGRPGTAVTAVDGQRVEVTVRIWRGAVIAGVVRDEAGSPVEGVPVTAVASRSSGSSLLTLSNNGVSTNERGEYRIFGLEPGGYAVSVVPPSGGGGPLAAMTDADVDAAFEAIRKRSTAPPTGAVATGAAEGQPLEHVAYAPVFFPGTTRAADAVPIVLQAGQEADGIDLQLQRVRTSTIDGIVVRPDGQTSGAVLQLVPAPGPSAQTSAAPTTVWADPSGHFSIPQVTPGEYELIANASATRSAPLLQGGAVTPPVPEGPSLWGTLVVAVTGGDLANVTVPVQPGIAVTGQIRFAIAPGDATPVPDVSAWRLSLVTPADAARKPGVPSQSIVTQSGVRVAADGTFTIPNAAPVASVLAINGRDVSATSWRPLSAMLNGRDLLDHPFELTAADAGAPLVVTMTRRHSTLSGAIETRTGGPASDIFVIAFAIDSAMWGPNARRVQAVRPGVDGRYAMTDLPPGDYLLAAVTDVDPDEWQNPAFLATLVSSAVKITVGAGETAAPTLRIGG
jgi:hypothetical protein